MSAYEVNEDKPERLLLGYVTLRGPDLEQVYRFIESHSPCPTSEIVDELFLDDGTDGSSHHDECLKFLQAVDMIRETDDGYEVVNGQICADRSFQLKLLHHLHRQQDRQASVVFILDLAAKEDLATATKSELLKTIERSEENVYEFSWTNPKINMWRHLMDYIGVIQTDTESVISFYPRRDLVLELLADYENDAQENDLAGFFDYIEATYWNCFTPAGQPTIYGGMSAVLLNLNDSGAISLQSYSDAPTVRLKTPDGEGYEKHTNFSLAHENETEPTEVAE